MTQQTRVQARQEDCEKDLTYDGQAIQNGLSFIYPACIKKDERRL